MFRTYGGVGKRIFERFHFAVVVNLAAQAGVRYSKFYNILSIGL